MAASPLPSPLIAPGDPNLNTGMLAIDLVTATDVVSPALVGTLFRLSGARVPADDRVYDLRNVQDKTRLNKLLKQSVASYTSDATSPTLSYIVRSVKDLQDVS